MELMMLGYHILCDKKIIKHRKKYKILIGDFDI